MLFIIVSSIIFIPICILVIRLLYLSGSTQGNPVERYPNPKSALIIVDMQNDTLSVPEYENAAAILKKVNSCIEYASKSNIEIIYIKQQYRGFPDTLLTGGMYQKKTPGVELSSELLVQSDNIFTKLQADTFSDAAFEKFLIEKNINLLYLAGADVSTCIYKTALGGINRGYRVVAIDDCLFSVKASRLDQMLDKYQRNNIEIINSTVFRQSQADSVLN